MTPQEIEEHTMIAKVAARDGGRIRVGASIAAELKKHGIWRVELDLAGTF